MSVFLAQSDGEYQTVMAGELAQPADARPLRHGLGQIPGPGCTVPVHHQFREEHKISLGCDRPLAPAVDGGQHTLRFAQESIHTDRRHTSDLHGPILPGFCICGWR